MRFDAISWFLLAIVQMVLGAPLILFFGYGIAMILCGVWNVRASWARLQHASLFKKRPELIWPYFRDLFDPVMYCLVFNLIFGGLIGVFGCVFDLLLREYVIKRKDILLSGGDVEYD